MATDRPVARRDGPEKHNTSDPRSNGHGVLAGCVCVCVCRSCFFVFEFFCPKWLGVDAVGESWLKVFLTVLRHSRISCQLAPFSSAMAIKGEVHVKSMVWLP